MQVSRTAKPGNYWMKLRGLSCNSLEIEFETEGCHEIPGFSPCVTECSGEGSVVREHGPAILTPPLPPLTCPQQGHSCRRKLALDFDLVVIVQNRQEQQVAEQTFQTISILEDCASKRGAREPPWGQTRPAEAPMCPFRFPVSPG